jgi:hypothetical protein
MYSVPKIDMIFSGNERLGEKDMKGIKIVGMTVVGYLLC